MSTVGDRVRVDGKDFEVVFDGRQSLLGEYDKQPEGRPVRMSEKRKRERDARRMARVRAHLRNRRTR